MTLDLIFARLKIADLLGFKYLISVIIKIYSYLFTFHCKIFIFETSVQTHECIHSDTENIFT